jgi:hypothetical protein
MGSCLTINMRSIILHLSACGYPIDEASSPTPIYNDIEACTKWCHNMTSKSNHHIELQENVTRGWVDKDAITVSQVSGKSNPANIFTKEMRGGANFRRLWDSFMCRGSDFLKSLYTLTLPILNAMASDPFHIAQSAHYILPSAPGTLEVLLSHTSLTTGQLLQPSGGGACVGSSHTDVTDNASSFSCPRGRRLNIQRRSAILLQSASNPSCASGKGIIGSPTRLGPWLDSRRPCGKSGKCRAQRGDGQNVSSGLPSVTIGWHAQRASVKRLRRSWKRGTCRKHSAS